VGVDVGVDVSDVEKDRVRVIVPVEVAVRDTDAVTVGEIETVAVGIEVGDALNDIVLLTLGLVDTVADRVGVGVGDDAISISHMYRRLPSPATSLNRFKYC
jgi:hypothetical protein